MPFFFSRENGEGKLSSLFSWGFSWLEREDTVVRPERKISSDNIEVILDNWNLSGN